ncbi:MAG: hypothetical protein R3B09_01720 [Nannocystaceae bacterium]
MIIEVGSQPYERLFGFRDFVNDQFTTRLPPHHLLVDALADPSKSIEAIDLIIGDERPEGLLYSAGLQDLTLGSQILMHARVAASRIGGTLSIPGNGMLTALTDGLEGVMQRIKIPTRMSDADVMRFLADTTFAIGMRALGAIGPVGKIAAAIIGFARGIFQFVRDRKQAEKVAKEHRQAWAYARLPPLQEPDSNVDAWYVESVLKPKMEGGSWTAIFAPRFDSDDWVGIARNGGHALAPGGKTVGVDDFGAQRDVFKPSGGIGLIPGLDQITSVIQVSLPEQELAGWKGGKWPIRPEMIQDVGKFFVNTGRLAAMAWSWATEVDASPDLFKIDLVDLHHRWRRYCDAGRRFLMDNATDWATNHGAGRVLSGNLEYVYGSAIGCAIGAWRCMPQGNGYRQLTPGLRGDAIMGYGYGRESIGCVMDPPSMLAMANGESCFQTLYELWIKGVLDRAAERQRYFLWHSLVAAYVRADFDAFKDPWLKNQLMKARKAMLQHPDRKLVQLVDVAEDEPGVGGSGKTWKQELIASGVKSTPSFVFSNQRVTGGPQPGTLAPDKPPVPKVPVYRGPMAWGDVPGPAPAPLWGWRETAAAAGGIGLGLAGAKLVEWLRERRT